MCTGLGFQSSLFQGTNMENCCSRVTNRLLHLHQWWRIIFSNWFCSGTTLSVKVESMFLLSEGKMSATRNRTNSCYSSYSSQRSWWERWWGNQVWLMVWVTAVWMFVWQTGPCPTPINTCGGRRTFLTDKMKWIRVVGGILPKTWTKLKIHLLITLLKLPLCAWISLFKKRSQWHSHFCFLPPPGPVQTKSSMWEWSSSLNKGIFVWDGMLTGRSDSFIRVAPVKDFSFSKLNVHTCSVSRNYLNRPRQHRLHSS